MRLCRESNPRPRAPYWAKGAGIYCCLPTQPLNLHKTDLKVNDRMMLPTLSEKLRGEGQQKYELSQVHDGETGVCGPSQDVLYHISGSEKIACETPLSPCPSCPGGVAYPHTHQLGVGNTPHRSGWSELPLPVLGNHLFWPQDRITNIREHLLSNCPRSLFWKTAVLVPE